MANAKLPMYRKTPAHVLSRGVDMKIGLVAPVGAAERQHEPFAFAPTGAFVQDRCFSCGSRRRLIAGATTVAESATSKLAIRACNLHSIALSN